MRIALDGMGGDYAPREIIKGAVEALKEIKELYIIITGDEDILRKELSKYNNPFTDRISIFPTEQVVTMHDHPKDALLMKKNSSLYKAVELVKEGDAVGVVSAGNTGAQMAISLFVLGRIKGILRPAIAVPIPYPNGEMGILIDGGANADCNEKILLQFALLGKVYLENILNRDVTIGLLNIGAEKEKGSKLTQRTYELIEKNFDNFKGNVEGNDLLSGKVDVVVTDGFTGNIALKSIEGAAEQILRVFKEQIKANKLAALGALIMQKSLKKVFKQFDYETFGGSPLLGVNGISIIAHGRSSFLAVKNAIKMCYKMETEHILEKTINQLNDESFKGSN
jgi:glycerol-3-phosphate acyltransferase PlsX